MTGVQFLVSLLSFPRKFCGHGFNVGITMTHQLSLSHSEFHDAAKAVPSDMSGALRYDGIAD